jgi:hypothetical protein
MITRKMLKPFKLVRLTIKNGEYEHNALMIIRRNEKADNVAKDFYGDDEGELDSEGNGYYFNNQTLHVSVRSTIPISGREKKMLERLQVAFY